MYVPDHWICALINGDETSFDYYDDPKDYESYQQFCQKELPPGCIISVVDDSEGNFMKYHHARDYDVLACNCTQIVVTVIK